MTNLELEMEYVALKLAGKLKGCYYTDPGGREVENTNEEYWRTEEEMRDLADMVSCELNEDVLVDMSWEEFKVQNHIRFLFDVD